MRGAHKYLSLWCAAPPLTSASTVLRNPKHLCAQARVKKTSDEEASDKERSFENAWNVA